MDIFATNLGSVLFVFPGILFTLFAVLVWLVYGNFMFQKIDKNEDLRLKDIFMKIFDSFKEQGLMKKNSKGMIFLYSKFVILFLFQMYVLINFFSSDTNNSFSLIFMLILALLFEILYQLDLGSGIFIFVGKIFAEFIIIISLGLLLLTQGQFSFVKLSSVLIGNMDLVVVLLLILIIFSMSKTSTYMDYKKVPFFRVSPNDLMVYKSKIENGNTLENLIRWLTDSYYQITLSELIVLLIFPSIKDILLLTNPSWVLPFLFVVFQITVLFLSVFLNLLNATVEFKIPNPQTKGILFILVFISLFLFLR